VVVTARAVLVEAVEEVRAVAVAVAAPAGANLA
jgi:hypothetical protein